VRANRSQTSVVRPFALVFLLATTGAAQAQSVFSHQIPLKLLSHVPSDERLTWGEKT